MEYCTVYTQQLKYIYQDASKYA